MTREELKTGNQYWFCPSGTTDIICLTFMNKVDGRNAFRFSQIGKKQLFLLHEDRLDKLFNTYRQARQNLIKSLKNVIKYYEREVEREGIPIRPPMVAQWTVARGFPRLKKFGRR